MWWFRCQHDLRWEYKLFIAVLLRKCWFRDAKLLHFKQFVLTFQYVIVMDVARACQGLGTTFLHIHMIRGISYKSIYPRCRLIGIKCWLVMLAGCDGMAAAEAWESSITDGLNRFRSYSTSSFVARLFVRSARVRNIVPPKQIRQLIYEILYVFMIYLM